MKVFEEIKSNFLAAISKRYIYTTFFIGIIIVVYIHYISHASDIFKGAFIGVIVSYILYVFKDIQALNVRRYNCMVYLDQECHRCLNDIQDNIFQINNILKARTGDFLFPIEIIITDDYIKNLGRISLRNEIFSFYIGLRKFNLNMQATQKSYERNLEKFTKTPFFSQVEGDTFLHSLNDSYKKRLEELKKTAETLFNETKDCLVKLRFFLRIDKPLFFYFWRRYYKKDEYKSWLIEDKIRLEQEIATNKKR